MLGMEDAHSWMDPDNADFTQLISSDMPQPLDAVPVSTYVNNARHKDDRCLQPIAEPVVIAGSGG
jgi:putative SOS response-associated peptidase YedK